MLTTILWFIVVGAVIGALARLIVPGRNPIGILLTILVGIAGAILGGVVADALGAGTLVAIVFAIVIAALVLRERVGAWRWIAVGVMLAGMMLIRS